jgi:hypothetical protein
VPTEAEAWLNVDSFDQLMEHEAEIVKRIADFPNGGNLFLCHPLMLLADLGVVLSERARQELLTVEPQLAALSAVPYRALRSSTAPQKTRVHVRGLFRRRGL